MPAAAFTTCSFTPPTFGPLTSLNDWISGHAGWPHYDTERLECRQYVGGIKSARTHLACMVRSRRPYLPAASHEQRMVPPTRSMHKPRPLWRAEILRGEPTRLVLGDRVDVRYAEAGLVVAPEHPRDAIDVKDDAVAAGA